MISALFCYTIAAYGLSNLLVYGSGPYNILGGIRLFCNQYFPMIGKMLDCMMCTSCNIGIVLSIINIVLFSTLPFTPFNILFAHSENSLLIYGLIVFLDAVYTSGSVWLIHTLQEMMEVKD